MECLYYTDSIINNKSTLTKLSIIFDKVRTFSISPNYYLEKLEKKWTNDKDRLEFTKIKNEELFRKIASAFFVGSSATSIVTYFLSLPLSAQLTAFASFTGKILLDIHKYQSDKYRIRNESANRGLVFLIDLEKKYG